jgi:hypothetical protein
MSIASLKNLAVTLSSCATVSVAKRVVLLYVLPTQKSSFRISAALCDSPLHTKLMFGVTARIRVKVENDNLKQAHALSLWSATPVRQNHGNATCCNDFSA